MTAMKSEFDMTKGDGRIPELRPNCAASALEGMAGNETTDILLQREMTKAIRLAEHGNLVGAETCFRELVDKYPNVAPPHHNLSVCLIEQGKLTAAQVFLLKALAIDPEYGKAHATLGKLLHDQEKHNEAIMHLRKAVLINPRDTDALNNLGVLLNKLRRSNEAVIFLRQAIRLEPGRVDVCNNLGIALTAGGRLVAARRWLTKAINLSPDYAIGHANLGNAYKEAGKLPESLACYELALALDPSSISARWNRSLALLQGGDMERGWVEYEARWQRHDAFRFHFPKPMWDGQSILGKTILLHAEQGLGDMLQFVRYAPLLRNLGATVIFACPEPLLTLLKRWPGADHIIGESDTLPAFDTHAPLMSLPRLLKTTLTTIPRSVPYILAEPSRCSIWKKRLQDNSVSDDLKVGLVWQGNPHHQWDHFRSIGLQEFDILDSVEGIRFFSLQTGPGAEQISSTTATNSALPISNLQDDLNIPPNWADIAAIMKNLDLVITVDTATAHLAGALGIPVWILLAAISDWRWLQNRRDSPWYPTARLFRQQRAGKWKPTMRQVAQELKLSIPYFRSLRENTASVCQ